MFANTILEVADLSFFWIHFSSWSCCFSLMERRTDQFILSEKRRSSCFFGGEVVLCTAA